MQTTKTRPSSMLSQPGALRTLLIVSLCWCHVELKRHDSSRLSGLSNDDALIRNTRETSSLIYDSAWLGRELDQAASEDLSWCGRPLRQRSQDQLPTQPSGNDRIFNGYQAEAGQFPWIVLVRSTSPSGRRLSCTGSIVSNRHILTAAHCVTDCILGETAIADPTQVTAYGGENRYNLSGKNPGGETLPIDYIVLPKKHQACFPNPTHDLAVLTVAYKPMALRSPVAPYSKLAKICLDNSQIYFSPAVLAGFGETRAGLGASSQLMWMKTMIKERCPRSLIMPKTVCAMEMNSTACHGDSGAPLVTESYPGRWSQIAIMVAVEKQTGNCHGNVRMIFNTAKETWERYMTKT